MNVFGCLGRVVFVESSERKEIKKKNLLNPNFCGEAGSRFHDTKLFRY